MNLKTPNKIRIIGSVGSGKTTLARELSSILNIPYYELDNVVWMRDQSGDIKRTDAERDSYLKSIIFSRTWIIEGVHNETWVSASFHQADLIIFLDPRYSVRTYRIMKRFFLQKLRVEKSNYKPTVKIFLNMFKWNRYFEEKGKPNFLHFYGKYRNKLLVISTNREAAYCLDRFRRNTQDLCRLSPK
ncbi:DNA topology modulation protein FlaR [Metabacillus idriensis]|uniref:DNA topology modulation protein FlaR n=1 Tax=Metabacillus idriensis TaxID=324768 RepID=UPI0008A89AC7|nr:DNA topology modulation protein FlaR [Metabacillus idriensis]MCM3596773.1 DNA topology modulation protein FlaR [Metabacillus idriensis]OHR63625.1 DNA topology modulation protein FlaR [Bacillus sp. HMSC76G11]